MRAGTVISIFVLYAMNFARRALIRLQIRPRDLRFRNPLPFRPFNKRNGSFEPSWERGLERWRLQLRHENTLFMRRDFTQRLQSGTSLRKACKKWNLLHFSLAPLLQFANQVIGSSGYVNERAATRDLVHESKCLPREWGYCLLENGEEAFHQSTVTGNGHKSFAQKTLPREWTRCILEFSF